MASKSEVADVMRKLSGDGRLYLLGALEYALEDRGSDKQWQLARKEWARRLLVECGKRAIAFESRQG